MGGFFTTTNRAFRLRGLLRSGRQGTVLCLLQKRRAAAGQPLRFFVLFLLFQRILVILIFLRIGEVLHQRKPCYSFLACQYATPSESASRFRNKRTGKRRRRTVPCLANLVDIHFQSRYNRTAVEMFSSPTLYCKRPIPFRFRVFLVCSLSLQKGLPHFFLSETAPFLLIHF